MRKLRILGLIVAALAWLGMQAVSAKGANYIVITQRDLGEPIIVDDLSMASQLSLTMLEDVDHGAIDEPTNLDMDVGYRLERGFYEENVETFVPWDASVYYPDPEGGRGYVFYDGIINGGSEYDKKWYRARMEAEALLQQVLYGAQTQAYVVAISNQGRINFFQPYTLHLEATLQIEGEFTAINAIGGDDFGQSLILETNTGGILQPHIIDLQAGTKCYSDEFLPRTPASVYEQRARDVAFEWSDPANNIWYEMVDGTAWRQYLFLPIGRNAPVEDLELVDDEAIKGGILSLNPSNTEIPTHIRPELAFTQAIRTRDGFYGLEAPLSTEETSIARISESDFRVVRRNLGSGEWRIASVMADLSHLADGNEPVMIANCPYDDSQWQVAADFSAVETPVTATPAP
jgi:hypothetical protein